MRNIPFRKKRRPSRPQPKPAEPLPRQPFGWRDVGEGPKETPLPDSPSPSIGPDNSETAFLKPGEELAGRYRIAESLGTDGTGIIYRAHDLQTDEQRIVKTISVPLIGTPRAQERFLRDASVTRSLKNPGLLRVYEVGDDAFHGVAYIVMESCGGATLDELLQSRGGRLSAQDSIAVARQIALALAYAHRTTLHLDLNPTNVFVTEDGVVKVADVGLAKAVSRGRLRRNAVLEGTGSYHAPEMAAHLQEVDARADIYSLGMLLYRMLTGSVPAGRVRPPSALALGISPELERVVMKCLKSRPEERYGSMRLLERDLRYAEAAAPSSVIAWSLIGIAVAVLALGASAVFLASDGTKRVVAARVTSEPAPDPPRRSPSEVSSETPLPDKTVEAEPVWTEVPQAADIEPEWTEVPDPNASVEPEWPEPIETQEEAEVPQTRRTPPADMELQPAQTVPDASPSVNPPAAVAAPAPLESLPPLEMPDSMVEDASSPETPSTIPSVRRTPEARPDTDLEQTITLEPIEIAAEPETSAAPPAPSNANPGVAQTIAEQARVSAAQAGAREKAEVYYASAESALEVARAHASRGDKAAATDAYRRAAEAYRVAERKAQPPAVSLRLARVVPPAAGQAPRAHIAFDLLDGSTRVDEFSVGETVADGWRVVSVNPDKGTVALQRNGNTRELAAEAGSPAVAGIAPVSAPAVAAAPEPETERPPVSEDPVTADVRRVVEAWARASREAKLSELLDLYADQVSPYFTLARASREDVRVDKLNFFGTYPEVNLGIRNLQITHRSDGSATAAFDKSWDVKGKTGRHFAGEERQELELRSINGEWKITAEKELKVYWVKRSWVR